MGGRRGGSEHVEHLTMDQGQILQMMLQYCKENMLFESMKAIEDETEIKLYDWDMKGSELQTILDEHEERRVAEICEATEVEEDPLKLIPDSPAVSNSTATFDKLHKANVITVKFNPHDENMMASGGAGAIIVLSDLEGTELKTLQTAGKGALLSLDFHPTDPKLLLSAFMDGSHALSDIESGEVVQQFKDHQKFVTRVAWSLCGTLFASCSHDRFVRVYSSDENGLWTASHTQGFTAIPESICFAEGFLVVSVRDDHRLHYIELQTGLVTFQNTSTIEGDTHVWCSVLDLTLTPCHKYVLMCTDQSKNVLMPFNGPSKHVRTFYGAVSDQLSTPRATWSPDGRNLYCTSQDHSVLVWDVSNQAVLNRLKGHTKNVRGIDHHHTRPLLASCGFDRKMMMWE